MRKHFEFFLLVAGVVLTSATAFGDQTRDEIEEKNKQWMNAVKQNPKDPHANFSLAQTFKGLKNYDQAIHWYLSRIDLEGSSEELWASKYMLAECFEEQGEWSNALYWYLEAFQSKPDRAEPLKKIATHYRFRGENELSYLFAKHGTRLSNPHDQNLYLLPPLKNYELKEELSISSYYTQFKEEGCLATNDLILTKGVPWHIKDQAYRNILFYLENLKADFQPIQIDLPLIQKWTSERYHPMNPSIQKTENGYKVICRAVNYTQTGAKTFNTIDTSGIFRTRNFLLDYTKEFKLLEQKEIIEDLPRKKIPAFNLEGLEDCRLFHFDEKFWFTCTTSDTNPTGNRQISLCALPNSAIGPNIFVETLIPLIGKDLSKCEKNWLPFVKDDELLLVYSYDPLTIYKPNLQTGLCETVLCRETEHDFSSFRGSAAPVPFDEGYLILVHEVVLLPDYHRCYLHRFLYLDQELKISLQTKPFTFMHQGVEYCCSMTLDHTGKKLILPIGVEDHEAYLCFVDLDTIRSMLLPLPKSN